MRDFLAKASRYAARRTRFHLRTRYRPRTVTLDGYTVVVDYEVFSPAMVRVFLDESYERKEREVIPRIVKSGDRVLEIGGGIGILAMKCAAIVGDESVLCIEADPRLVDLARANHQLNGVHVQIEQKVLLGASGERAAQPTVPFYVHEDFWESSLARRDETQYEIKVPAESFEARLAEYRPTVLVIDIEGGEVELLEGSQLAGVRAIILETHYGAAGRQPVNRMIGRLYDRGFAIDLSRSCGELLVLLHE